MAMETAQQPDLAFEKLCLLGDYQHNCDVLDLGEGELIVVRMPKEVEEGIAANFLPCPSFMAFFMASELWRHRQNCPQPSQETPPKWSTVQQEAKLLLPTTVLLPTKDVKKSFHYIVLSSMKNDEISAIARKDALIVNFGAAIFEKVGTKNINYVSQKNVPVSQASPNITERKRGYHFRRLHRHCTIWRASCCSEWSVWIQGRISVGHRCPLRRLKAWPQHKTVCASS